jgi:hypothetical protein
MQARIDRMYHGDCALIITFLVFLWLVVIRVLAAVVEMAGSAALKTVVLGAGLLAASSATMGLTAVLDHLKRHKNALYAEDVAAARSLREAHGDSERDLRKDDHGWSKEIT